MKKTSFVVGLLLSLSLQAKVLIITDIDDTIKQTNVLNSLAAAMSTFGKTPDFQHMKTIFKEIADHHKNEKIEITYTSGSLKCITNQPKWLAKKEFPAGLILQRRCNNGEFSFHVPTKDFKVKAISSLLRQLPDEENHIYMFGDSGEFDPEAYKAVQDLFPQFQYHVFIRDIGAKGLHYDDRLKEIKVEKNNYFLSELDLYKYPDFSFLSSGLKSSLEADLKDHKLLAKYHSKNLAKRLHKEAKLKLKEAHQVADQILENYNGF